MQTTSTSQGIRMLLNLRPQIDFAHSGEGLKVDGGCAHAQFALNSPRPIHIDDHSSAPAAFPPGAGHNLQRYLFVNALACDRIIHSEGQLNSELN